ncbi:MAG: SPFH domain-containing protein, partial [Planctomycetota bacterium]
DLRDRRLELSGQEVLTRDGVSVKISLTVTWRVVNAIEVVARTSNAEMTLYSAVQLELREAIQGIDFEDLLQDRGYLERALTTPTRESAAAFGLEVQRVALKDLIVGGELKRALSEVVRARAEAKAKLEQTRGETAALRNSLNAAKLFEEHAGLKTLRLLETARTAAENDKNTLVLGLSQEAQGLDSQNV